MDTNDTEGLKKLALIAKRVQHNNKIEPLEYRFISVNEANYRSLRECGAPRDVQTNAFLEYVREVIKEKKLPKKAYETILRCSELCYEEIARTDNPASVITYIGNNAPRLATTRDMERFREELLEKKPAELWVQSKKQHVEIEI